MVYPIIIALIFMILDVVTGFIKASFNKEINSQKMREGLMHKAAFCFIIILAVACQIAMQYIPELGVVFPAIPLVCAYVILAEIISIVENIGEMNPALRDSKLLSLFKVSKDDVNE